MSKKTALIISIILNLIFLSLFIFYEKEDKRYISKVKEKDNISMLKIVGEDTEVIKQVPQSGQWVMSYTCDDENAELYWNEKKRTVVAKNISATECTLIFRESDAIFRMISMYVDGEYVTELDNTKKYEMESYECTNGEELTWDTNNSKLSIQPISKDTSCYVNFNEKIILPTLTEKILADNTAQSDANIDFAYTSNGCNTSTACSAGTVVNQNQVTNGLYYTSDTSKTEGGKVVYYYRGAVENNYLVFGTHQTDYKEVRGYYSATNSSYIVYNSLAECNNASSYNYNCTELILASAESPMCWRIVRTVEDGSIRLRYGGAAIQNGETYTCPQTGTVVNIASSQKYYTSVDNKSYVNYKTSSIRTVVENWYRDNIWKNGQNTKVTNLVADTPYCNDMTEPTTTNNFGALDRLYTNKSPQYKCPSSTYAYTVAKGDLTYPVGLLTADEFLYAGGVFNRTNSSYYLNTGQNCLTMSPSNFYSSTAQVFAVNSIGGLYITSVGHTSAAVPAVSLKPEATVKRGTGAYNDPYVINTD